MATVKKSAASTKVKKPVGPKPGEYPGKIVDIDVSSEMSESFLEYELLDTLLIDYKHKICFAYDLNSILVNSGKIECRYLKVY